MSCWTLLHWMPSPPFFAIILAYKVRKGDELVSNEEVGLRLNKLRHLPIYQGRQEALLTDLYQLTMMYGYYKSGHMDKEVVFDVFYRSNPCDNGYVIVAGLEQVVLYLTNLRFRDEELEYLKSTDLFDDGFLELLADFEFHGSLYAIPEGTVVFPNEPVMRIEGRLFELQLIESALLSFVNHQSLIATKASRIVSATGGQVFDDTGSISEFGLRRAQNADAAMFGARSAFIAGCSSTSNVAAGFNFGIPVSGTQAHSWIQSFPTELEAFRTYADAYPNNVMLLVDTYDVLRSGIPNAIMVGREMRARGYDLQAVRIDSGDLAYLSKEARERLNQAGFTNTRIIVSDDLDEDTIRDLLSQGAKIDGWGVGTALITSKGCSSLGGVYKLAAEKTADGTFSPRIKISENPFKVTNPGRKKVVRFYVDELANADLIMLEDEPTPTGEPVLIFDPVHTYKQKTLTRYRVQELLAPIIDSGKLVYLLPTLKEIQQHAKNELRSISSETRRAKNPHVYHVDLSRRLWELKRDLVESLRV